MRSPLSLIGLCALALLPSAAVLPCRQATARDGFSARASGGRDHWAWTPPSRPRPPDVDGRDRASSAVDLFILARLEAAGLEPAGEATREALIRRAALDLLGLPPSEEEVAEFVADERPDAWPRVIDRLLASPRHGERQGRRWLDLVRYAESNGFEHDEVRPDAWRYRDYVIDSFNADRPYDRFIEEQLAGDLLFPDEPDARIATGYALLGPDMTDAADQVQRRQHTLGDMTDSTGLVFLGLTLGCARCHDHKLEPITQRDYYSFLAFFDPSEFKKDLPLATSAELEAHELAVARWKEARETLSSALEGIEGPTRARLRAEKLAHLDEEARIAHETPEPQRTAAQKELVEQTKKSLEVGGDELPGLLDPAERSKREELLRRAARLEAEQPSPLPVAMGLAAIRGPSAQTFILERGEVTCPTEAVAPGIPSILEGAAPLLRTVAGSDTVRDPTGPSSSGAPAATAADRATSTLADAATATRADLARWIASPRNPLTARVIVNRIWQGLFGRGIVPSASDFGLQGERPTHPELLDWLAVELVERGWSLKALERELLLSAAYRQSTRGSARALERDPENRLLWRQGRKRLEAEEVRDALLAVSGLLERSAGGPSVFPPLPGKATDGSRAWKEASPGSDRHRRGIYIFQRRNFRFPFLEAFDLPDSGMSCPRRLESTTSSQALALLNGEETLEAARALAEAIAADGRSPEDPVAKAFRRVLGRSPRPEELDAGRELAEAESLETLCRALFNVNEFLFID